MLASIPYKFWLENFHFIIYVLAGLSFIAVGWLNFDSQIIKKDFKIALRAYGFFVLTIWAFGQAPGYSFTWVNYINFFLELAGIFFIAYSFYLDKVPVLPNEEKLDKKSNKNDPPEAANVGLILLPTKITLIFWVYSLRRIWLMATKGLVKDFLGLRTAFLIITLARIVSMAEIFTFTKNATIYNLVREYSFFWIMENLLMLIGAIILLKWAFYYLRFRPTPKLFVTFISASVIILIISTVSFTAYLFSISQKNSLEILKKSAAVFEYSIKELARQTHLAAYSLAQRSDVINGAQENNSTKVKNGLGDPIKDLKIGGVIITNRSGEALEVTGSNVNVGDSMIDDLVVAKTLKGNPTDSIIKEKLQSNNQLIVRSGFPIVKNNETAGTVIVDYPIDQGFVDNVQKVTGLDVTINYGKIHTAATFLNKNEEQITGTEITNKEVLRLINEKTNEAWTWSGSEMLVDEYYLTSYRSLADADNNNIGSLLVGQDKNIIIDGLNQSVRLTFLTTIILILISLGPLYYLSKNISS